MRGADIDGDETRERDRGLRRGLASAAIYRVVSGLGPLLVVPIALAQLGRTTYGVWMTAAGLTAFLAFADLGLGNALMTKLGGLSRGVDDALVRKTLGVTYTLLIGVCLSSIALVAVLWTVTPWDKWIGLSSSVPATRPIVLLCLVIFALNIPASLIIRVQFGLQETASSYLWQCAGPMLSLIGCLLCSWAGTSDVVFVAAAVAGPLGANLACTSWWFSRHRDLRPGWTRVTPSDALPILRMGGLFLGLSLVMSVAMSLDVLLIPRHLGVAEVTDFSVPWRVFSQLGLLVTLASLPLWPASAQALAKGELEWLRARVRKMLVINVTLIGPPCIVAVTFGPQLLRLWLGEAVQSDRVLIAGFAVWWCLMGVMYPFFMVQNAAGNIRPQLYGWTAFLVGGLIAKTAYLDITSNIRLLPWISVAIYAVTVLPAASVGYRGAMRGAVQSRSVA